MNKFSDRPAPKNLPEKVEIDKYIKSLTQSKTAVKNIKKVIASAPPEQMEFSFMPTVMARISPFYPINRNKMKDRQYKEMVNETSWGKITFSGEVLSIYDESILLSLLFLIKKHQSDSFATTRNELCKIMNVKPNQFTYSAIWESLKRLTNTNICLEVLGKKKKVVQGITGNILTGAIIHEKTKKLLVKVNPYFIEMFAESFVTAIDISFRAKLSGDISKAMYRFLQSQRQFYKDKKYTIHVIKFAHAINLNMDLSTIDLKKRLRTGLKELKKAKFIRYYAVSRNDLVSISKI